MQKLKKKQLIKKKKAKFEFKYSKYYWLIERKFKKSVWLNGIHLRGCVSNIKSIRRLQNMVLGNRVNALLCIRNLELSTRLGQQESKKLVGKQV